MAKHGKSILWDDLWTFQPALHETLTNYLSTVHK